MAGDGGDESSQSSTDEGGQDSAKKSSRSSGRSSKTSKSSKSGASSSGGSAGSQKRSSSRSSGSSSRSRSENGRSSAPRAESSQRISPSRIARQAAADLLELTGKEPEGITGLERSEEGWTVQVEVVELRRIPSTTDVLAVYEIDTDDRGSLMGYRRIRRYPRGAADGDDR